MEVTMHRHRSTLILASLAAVLLVGAQSADAGRVYVRGRGRVYVQPQAAVVVYPRGLYFGGGLLGNLILSQEGGQELLDNGGGLSLFAGWRLGQRLALELGYMGSFHNPAEVNTYYGTDVDYLVMSGFTGDARIYLGDDPMAPSEWYLQGGVGLYAIDSTYFGTQSVGSGFQLGGGIDFHVAPQIDLGLRGLYRGVSMGPPEERYDDTFISGVTLEGNVSFHF
jgi:opacity protein-like surface antigen